MKVIDLLNKATEEKNTLFGFELLPPLKGEGRRGVFHAVENVLDFNPAYVNITFHREGLKESINSVSTSYHIVRKRPGTVGIAAAIQRKYGVPAVPHIICGGLSKYDIEDALIDMDFLDIDNLLALRGDKRHYETYFIPHQEGHAHAVDLVKQISAMNRGEFIDGEVDECHHSKFCVGVAGYPEVHETALSAEDDIKRLKEKIDAGAEYVVTQMFFDNQVYYDFVERCRKAGITVPIVPGLKPLVNERHLYTLPKTFSIKLPHALSHEVISCRGDRKKIKEVGLNWSIQQAKDLKEHGVPAIHFYTMSRTENIAAIARQVF
ncbi:MAG: methylenetetrahydrofolate reductase [Muribaculaceae bacterium]|nr:methylenetetrahydrofolate reductase [Muribaculaceae bacterium]